MFDRPCPPIRPPVQAVMRETGITLTELTAKFDRETVAGMVQTLCPGCLRVDHVPAMLRRLLRHVDGAAVTLDLFRTWRPISVHALFLAVQNPLIVQADAVTDFVKAYGLESRTFGEA